MYTSIYLLPQFSASDNKKFQDRWQSKEGEKLQEKVIAAFESSEKTVTLTKDDRNHIEDERDLRGILFQGKTIKKFSFDTSHSLDFSYGRFLDCTFIGSDFSSPIFRFTSFYNITFRDCTFSLATFYACRFENVTFDNCHFIESNSIRNCRFSNTKFNDCFMTRNIFYSCLFDERTRVSLDEKYVFDSHTFNKKELSEIYKGIKDAYKAGEVNNRANEYYFMQKQAVTKYNIDDPMKKIGNYVLEGIAGYGIKPTRVLVTMVVAFVVFTLIFVAKVGFTDGLILSMGAFFTNGANSHLLENIGFSYEFLYLVESFLGITLAALFVTVLVNLWLQEH